MQSKPPSRRSASCSHILQACFTYVIRLRADKYLIISLSLPAHSQAFMAITVAMFTLLPIYFGAYYCQEENAYRVTMRIIELDSAASPSGTPNGALLGPVVVEAAMNSIRMKPHYHLGYQIETDTNQFSLDNVNGMGNRGVDADEYARHLVNEQT